MAVNIRFDTDVIRVYSDNNNELSKANSNSVVLYYVVLYYVVLYYVLLYYVVLYYVVLYYVVLYYVVLYYVVLYYVVLYCVVLYCVMFFLRFVGLCLVKKGIICLWLFEIVLL